MSTQVYLQNNTSFDFNVNTTVNPSINSSDWTVMNGKAPRHANTFLYWTYRGDGITNGTTFTFNSVVTNNGPKKAEVVDLQMQLQGTAVWSSMWAGFKDEAGSTAAFDSPWYPDPLNPYNVSIACPSIQYPTPENITWPQNGGWFTLSMSFVNHSSATTCTDNIQYTLNFTPKPKTEE